MDEPTETPTVRRAASDRVENLKVSGDVAPFGVRFPAEVKKRLQAEADRHGRSLNAEVIARLVRSLDLQDIAKTDTYLLRDAATDTLNDIDRAMLAVFRRMNPEKQLALLSLFK